MGRRRKFVVGSKVDPGSRAHLSRIIELLKEAHPRTSFINYYELTTGKARRDSRKKIRPSLSVLLQLLSKKDIDIVVADAREMPSRVKRELAIAAIPGRNNPFNVLISNDELILDDQPEDACLAVDNPISKGQLLYYRQDLKFVEENRGLDYLRRMMAAGKIDGFVYAASEVEALRRQDEVVEVFTSSICMPVAGQGAQGLIVRSDDYAAKNALRALNDPSSNAEVRLEKMFLECIEKKGKMPVGVLGNVEGDDFQLEAAIVAPDGSVKVSDSIEGRSSDESKIIGRFADALLSTWENRLSKVANRTI
ncbi:MAG: hypothetical protein JSV33_10150 [bacterium]|nr:MAG: hypothetical protein JSV33_10150 [bacterium]